MDDSTTMSDQPEAGGFEIEGVEAELCRLPEVLAVRIVTDHLDRPTEVHVLASPSKAPNQPAGGVQSVGRGSVGIALDRRIISVVQLAGGTASARPEPTSTPRVRLSAVQVETDGRRTTLRVTLRREDEE